MKDVKYIFEEAIENGWIDDVVTVVRKNGLIFDFVLPGEEVKEHEVVSREKLEDVMGEIEKIFAPEIHPKSFVNNNRQ